MKIAVIPGSYDPMTLGHYDIVKRAAALFDKVIVAVMVNSEKIDRAMFSLEEKAQIARLTCSDIENAEVIVSEGMLWQLAKSVDACAIVKGIRNADDLVYEQTMAEYNREHYPDAETVFLTSYGDLNSISSTLVRKKILLGEFPTDMMSMNTREYVLSLVAKKIAF